MSEVWGSGRECQAATAQELPRGAIPHPRSGAKARRSNPTPKERWLRSLEELSHAEGQEGQR